MRRSSARERARKTISHSWNLSRRSALQPRQTRGRAMKIAIAAISFCLMAGADADADRPEDHLAQGPRSLQARRRALLRPFPGHDDEQPPALWRNPCGEQRGGEQSVPPRCLEAIWTRSSLTRRRHHCTTRNSSLTFPHCGHIRPVIAAAVARRLACRAGPERTSGRLAFGPFISTPRQGPVMKLALAAISLLPDGYHCRCDST